MPRYHPYYCEENVYWLVQEPALAEGAPHAVFITNAERRCWFMHQHVSPPGVPAWWDYHVVALAHGQVWDLDSRLATPTPAPSYFDATLPIPDPSMMFRVVPALELLATFTSDRSHMLLPDGTYAAPPPAWEPPTAPGFTMNLHRFLDANDDIAGRVLDHTGLRGWLDEMGE